MCTSRILVCNTELNGDALARDDEPDEISNSVHYGSNHGDKDGFRHGNVVFVCVIIIVAVRKRHGYG